MKYENVMTLYFRFKDFRVSFDNNKLINYLRNIYLIPEFLVRENLLHQSKQEVLISNSFAHYILEQGMFYMKPSIFNVDLKIKYIVQYDHTILTEQELKYHNDKGIIGNILIESCKHKAERLTECILKDLCQGYEIGYKNAKSGETPILSYNEKENLHIIQGLFLAKKYEMGFEFLQEHKVNMSLSDINALAQILCAFEVDYKICISFIKKMRKFLVTDEVYVIERKELCYMLLCKFFERANKAKNVKRMLRNKLVKEKFVMETVAANPSSYLVWKLVGYNSIPPILERDKLVTLSIENTYRGSTVKLVTTLHKQLPELILSQKVIEQAKEQRDILLFNYIIKSGITIELNIIK